MYSSRHMHWGIQLAGGTDGWRLLIIHLSSGPAAHLPLYTILQNIKQEFQQPSYPLAYSRALPHPPIHPPPLCVQVYWLNLCLSLNLCIGLPYIATLPPTSNPSVHKLSLSYSFAEPPNHLLSNRSSTKLQSSYQSNLTPSHQTFPHPLIHPPSLPYPLAKHQALIYLPVKYQTSVSPLDWFIKNVYSLPNPPTFLVISPSTSPPLSTHNTIQQDSFFPQLYPTSLQLLTSLITTFPSTHQVNEINNLFSILCNILTSWIG